MKSKIKMMNVKPEISDDEIRSFMDFDKLLDNQKTFVRSRLIRNSGIAISAIAVVASLWFYSKPNESGEHKTTSDAKTDSQSTQIPLSRPDSIAKQEAREIEKVDQEPRKPMQHKNPQKISQPTVDIPPSQQKADSSAGLSAVYVQAAPVSGYPSLYEYFARELVYPAESVSDSIQGVVVVVFTISKEGKPEKISIEQSLGPAFDKEAMRVISNMPLWKPATYNNKPMASKMSVPLTFQVTKVKN
jgi:TonB family protein